VKRILSSTIYNAKAIDERPSPVETDGPTVSEAEGISASVISYTSREPLAWKYNFVSPVSVEIVFRQLSVAMKVDDKTYGA